MNDKHREVRKWLQEVYGDNPVPQYEVSESTISFLSSLQQKNLEAEQDLEIEKEYLQQAAEEYKAEAQRLQSILCKLHLMPSNLTNTGQLYLQSLACSAQAFDLTDPTLTAFLICISNIKMAKSTLASKRAVEQKVLEQLTADCKKSLHRQAQLQSALESAEMEMTTQTPVLEQRKKKAVFLNCKAKQYKEDIQQLERKLKISGCTPELYHQALLQQYEQVKELKATITPLKAKLESYQQLPPNITLAQVKIEEIRQELNRLTTELAERINMLHIKY